MYGSIRQFETQLAGLFQPAGFRLFRYFQVTKGKPSSSSKRKSSSSQQPAASIEKKKERFDSDSEDESHDSDDDYVFLGSRVDVVVYAG